MQIHVQLTDQPIAARLMPPAELGAVGAWNEFRGLVRGEEDGQPIRALEYEAYPEMAERELPRLLQELSVKHPCLSARVIHRLGVVPVGETAIYVGIASAHRAEGLSLMAAFMDQLKQDVPIWKRRALPLDLAGDDVRSLTLHAQKLGTPHVVPGRSLDEALADIRARCTPLPPERVPLMEGFGRVLRETVCASEDLPPFDRSAMDGFAIRRDDPALEYRVVDSVRAGDWKPRVLQPGEAVRMATGAALPGDGLQVVMQEDTRRDGDMVRLLHRDAALHVRARGEDPHSPPTNTAEKP